MNCAKHTDQAAVAYCRMCGKALCSTCVRDVQGTVYCEECLAARLNQAPAPGPGVAAAAPPVVVAGEGSPGLAAVLGFIPGVGAMYNGQFMKGFAHVVVFVCLIWITSHGFDLGGLLIAAWVFYMVFDAYTTAKARRFGRPLPDPLGFNKMFGPQEPVVAQQMHVAGERIGQGVENTFNNVAQRFQTQNGAQYQQAYVAPVEEVPEEPAHGVPASAYWLIGIGVLFLLSTLDVFHFNMGRMWPLFLIAIGVWQILRRNRMQRTQ